MNSLKGLHIIFTGVIFLLFTSCEKRDLNNPFDRNCSKSIFSPSNLNAEQEGNFIKLAWHQDNMNISGFKISRSENQGMMLEVANVGKTDTVWNDNNILGGTKYGYQLVAYAGENYSNAQTVYLTPVFAPTVTTSEITNITSTNAITGGNIISDGGTAIIEKGVCYSTSLNPTTASSKTSEGAGNGIFTSRLFGLSVSTAYYVRAYATNSKGTSYGNQVNFTTAANAVVPQVVTTAVTEITTGSAVSGGNITNDGGSAVMARGVCWNTTANPTIANNRTIDGAGIGNYTSNIMGLNPGTTYFVRAYATNGAGIAYGNQESFNTLNSLTDGLVAYYPFNGNANDESGNGNNGEINGATLTNDRKGFSNRAYLFNGISDYIKAKNTIVSNNFSINVWICTSNSNSRQDFISGGGYYITNQAFTGYTKNCIPEFDYTNVYAIAGHTSVCGDSWFFITLNVSMGITELFVNGTKEATFNSSCNIIGPDLNIGRSVLNGNYTFYFNGKIDDIRLYNRPLTLDEIQRLYNE